VPPAGAAARPPRRRLLRPSGQPPSTRKPPVDARALVPPQRGCSTSRRWLAARPGGRPADLRGRAGGQVWLVRRRGGGLLRRAADLHRGSPSSRRRTSGSRSCSPATRRWTSGISAGKLDPRPHRADRAHDGGGHRGGACVDAHHSERGSKEHLLVRGRGCSGDAAAGADAVHVGGGNSALWFTTAGPRQRVPPPGEDMIVVATDG
jgi:hypothetical protein